MLFRSINYASFKQESPFISKILIYYQQLWFVIMGILFIIMCFMKGLPWKRFQGEYYMLLGTLIMNVYYSLNGAGLMDYKKTIFITITYYILIIKLFAWNKNNLE